MIARFMSFYKPGVTNNDYPALGTLSGRTTKGYYACVHCDKNPLSQRLKCKIGYIGHRRYLPTDHDWRKNTKEFDGNTEEQEAPESSLQRRLQSYYKGSAMSSQV